MATNILRTLSPFTDLDNVFEQRISGDPTADLTGISPVGSPTDLNQRYCPASMGDLIASDTGILTISGTELRQVFAAIGTVVRWDGSLDDLNPLIGHNVVTTAPNLGGPSRPRLYFYGDGTILEQRGTNTTDDLVDIGRWDGIVADSSNTQLRFTVLDERINTSATSIQGDIGQWVTISGTIGVAPFIGLNISAPIMIAYNQEIDVRVEIRKTNDPSSTVTREVTFRAGRTLAQGGGGD